MEKRNPFSPRINADDGNAIQVALLDIIRALADDRLDTGKATALGYLLQTAAANLKNVRFGFHRFDMVTDLPAQDPHHRGVSPGKDGGTDHRVAPPYVVCRVEQGFSPADRRGPQAASSLPQADQPPKGA